MEKKAGENKTNKDIILLTLAKPLDKHGTTLVHIAYPPLISVLIFAMLLEIFTNVVSENIFSQFMVSDFSLQCCTRYSETTLFP